MTRDFSKGARASFYLMLFVMGCTFWAFIAMGRFRMSPEVYGSAVLRLPAVLWALAMLIPAAVYLAALAINGRRRWTPYIRIGCGFLISSYFSFFVLSAWPAAGGDLMVIASSVLMTKAAAMAYLDASELVGQWGWHDKCGL